MNGHISLGQVLWGQKALVTGANSGIGAAVAKALAEAGASVAINYVSNPEKTEALVEEIREAGGTAIGVHADVSQEDQVQAMFKEVIGAFGTLDILVNNAGLQRDAFIHDMSLADWNFVIGVNLTGQFLCAREAVREFMHRKVHRSCSCSAGKIICMSSVHDRIPWAGHSNYAASKGGVMLLMMTLAQEAGGAQDPRQQHLARRHQDADQQDGLGHPRSGGGPAQADPLRTGGQCRGRRPCRGLAVLGYVGLRHRATLYIDGGMTLYPGFHTGG